MIDGKRMGFSQRRCMLHALRSSSFDRHLAKGGCLRDEQPGAGTQTEAKNALGFGNSARDGDPSSRLQRPSSSRAICVDMDKCDAQLDRATSNMHDARIVNCQRRCEVVCFKTSLCLLDAGPRSDLASRSEGPELITASDP